MKDSGKRPTPKRAFFKRRDLWVILAVAAAALVVWLLLPRGGAAATAVVEVGIGEAQRVERLPLAPDRIVEIDAELPVRLEIRDGAIRFIDSVCPDHDCEHFGWQRHEGDVAICLPAAVVVRVEE